MGGVFGGVLLAAALLYAAAFRLPAPGRVFMGYLLNSGDAWGYQAFSEGYARGGWLIDNPLSDAFHEPAFFNLLWFALGKVRRLTGLPFLTVYYAFGVMAAGAMFWAILRFCRQFAGEGAAGRFAFLLASFGGGLGWITLLSSNETANRLRATDIYFSDGYPLQAALFAPHLALSIALMGTILLWFHRGVSTGRRGWSLGAALLTMALSFFHPYHLATVGCVAGAWVAVEQALGWKRLHRGWIDLGLLGLAVLPAAVYYRWLFRQPNWAMWATENVVRTRGVPSLLLGLGPLAGLAALGAWRRGLRHPDSGRRFLVVWSLVGIGLLHSYPIFKFEAKLVEGLVLPLAVMAAGAIFGPRDRAGGTHRRWVAAAAVLLILAPSHVMVAARSLDTVRQRDNYFPKNWRLGSTLARGEVEAIDFLGRLDSRQMIFAPPYVGFMIPGMAGMRPFIGSIDITPGFTGKFHIAQAVYYRTMPPQERYRLLASGKASLLWCSVRNRYAFDPSREPYLERIFANADVHIYAVRR